MRKLESKRRHISPLKIRYGHGRTGRTFAAGPESGTLAMFSGEVNGPVVHGSTR